MTILLMITSILFGIGIFNILAFIMKVPSLRKTKLLIRIRKKEKKKVRDSDAIIYLIAGKIQKYVYLQPHTKKKLEASIKSAGLDITPTLYVSLALAKALFVGAFSIPAFVIFPLLSIVIIFIAFLLYFKEIKSVDEIIKKRKEQIEYELPRFVASIAQSLVSTRDVRTILETYQKHAGDAMKKELLITTVDMGTGNYHAALARFDARISSATLSQVVMGLQGVLNGDNNIGHFKMMLYDLKNEEITRLKKIAMKRPDKIKKYSFALVGVMMMMYLGVMIYQIILKSAELF